MISSVELLLYNTVHVISTILTGGDALDILNARVTLVAGRRYTVLEMVAETMGGTIKQNKFRIVQLNSYRIAQGEKRKTNYIIIIIQTPPIISKSHFHLVTKLELNY